MLTEPAPNPPLLGPKDPVNVVVLVVPENASPSRILDVITETSSCEHPAVLLVLPRGVDTGYRHNGNQIDEVLDALWRTRAAGR
jgi:hypothetical protein